MKLSYIAPAAVIAAGAVWASASVADVSDLHAAAQGRQTFYPIGSASTSDGRMDADIYLMSAMSEAHPPFARAMVLLNVKKAPDGPFQVAEVQNINCTSHAVTTTYRMIFNHAGEALDGNAPQDGGSLLPPEAEAKTLQMLCSGVFPTNGLKDRTLADLR